MLISGAIVVFGALLTIYIYVRDGVHLTLRGQGKFYCSLRGAILGTLSFLSVSNPYPYNPRLHMHRHAVANLL